ncbi:MAG: phosphorylase, partial [Synechococcaceae cyanobacterium SM2_3_1]|nr:phosphorylase [Synechococcaceae cyanobacterium SM2_3_1]
MATAPHPPIDLIMVPQGAEHRAVMRGLLRSCFCPQVLPIPIGGQAARIKVEQWLQKHDLVPNQGVRIL